MSSVQCPGCQQPLPADPRPDTCPLCGVSLSEGPPRVGWQIGGADLRRVARYQRRLLWLVLVVVGVSAATLGFGPGVPPWVQGLEALPAVVLLAAVTILVQAGGLFSALGMPLFTRVVCFALLLVPWLNIAVVIALDQLAIYVLRCAGLRVGVLGVSDAQVIRQLDFHRCRVCGYSLVGNTSGRCPECGTISDRGASPSDRV